MRRVALFYISANPFHVWLNRRRLDSLSTAKVSLLCYYMCSFWKTVLLSPKRMKRANNILALLWKEFWPHRPPARILGSFMVYGLHFKNSYFIDIILGLLKNTFKKKKKKENNIKYIKNTHNSIFFKKLIKSRQKTWIDILPKRTYRWPTGTWKDAQHH